MAPLLIEGKTLGERRKHYNELVKKAIANNLIFEVPPINFDEEDIDNIFKIDIACHTQNVDYILEVLKCKDMLYVSRAIKQSKWIINDSKYANIINAEYLFNVFFPQTTSKARNKILLQIRLTLRDQKRVEEFCSHLMLQNLQNGLKWLPHCSVPYIENIIEKHATDIPTSLMTRLCKKSVRFLEIYVRNCNHFYISQMIYSNLFLLNKNMENVLDITDRLTHDCSTKPRFGPKPTQKIMKKFPERIMNNLEDYAEYIHLQTFAKFIKINEVKDFILKVVTNDNLRCWHKYDRIQHLIKRLPKEDKFNLVKSIFINKSHPDDTEVDITPFLRSVCKGQAYPSSPTSFETYRWYKFAPFDTAFKEMIKLIRNESKPSERYAMLAVILQSANKDKHNLNEVIQYYRERHINEPFKFKINFINNLLSKVDVFKYDLKTWGHLNDIFTSMEVYEDSKNQVQSCIKCIIIYNLIHDNIVPKIIEEKFEFDTFKIYQTKLDKDDKIKLFNYLYNNQIEKLNALVITNEHEFNEAIILLNNIRKLLCDWKKNVTEYTLILEHVKKLISIKQKNSWKIDISNFYMEQKSWRRHLFNESILLNPTPDVFINVLKHDSELVKFYENELLSLLFSNNKTIKRFLTISRVFWSQSMATMFKQSYFNAVMDNNKKKYPSAIFGLSLLLPQKPLLELIHKHIPEETKIDWKNKNESEFVLRKNIANKLYLARPQPSLLTVLLFAKGDYLQFVLPSLSSILYNMSSLQAQTELKTLFDAPVSLQKHGIRTALNKLKHDELILIFSELWSSTKNNTIRADIMEQTFNLLCKQNHSSDIDNIWSLLQTFINNCTSNENEIIYSILCRVDDVPMFIRPEFWLKSYSFFCSLPESENCKSFIANLKNKMGNILEFLAPDTVINIFLNSFENNFTKNIFMDSDILARYLMSARNVESQNLRYNQILQPIIEKALASWDILHRNKYYTRLNLTSIFMSLLKNFEDYVLDKNMCIPVVMFSKISKKLYHDLPIDENYFVINFMKLSEKYAYILDSILKTKSRNAYKNVSSDTIFDWKLLYMEAAPELSIVCLEILKQDVNVFGSQIYSLFAKSLQCFFINVFDYSLAQLSLLTTILECKDFIEGYLLVLKLIPRQLYKDKENLLRLEILNKIKCHPSNQIKMYYWNYKSSLPFLD